VTASRGVLFNLFGDRARPLFFPPFPERTSKYLTKIRGRSRVAPQRPFSILPPRGFAPTTALASDGKVNTVAPPPKKAGDYISARLPLIRFRLCQRSRMPRAIKRVLAIELRRAKGGQNAFYGNGSQQEGGVRFPAIGIRQSSLHLNLARLTLIRPLRKRFRFISFHGCETGTAK
jgi:hypothetical protein